VAAAHFPVEKFHAQFATAFGPGCEGLAAAQEMDIVADFEFDAGFAADILNVLLQPVFAGFADDQFFRATFCNDVAQSPGQRGFSLIVERKILQRQTPGSQRFCVVAHRRQEQRDARLMVPDMGGFAGRLDHHNAVTLAVDACQRGIFGVELVTQHKNQIAHRFSGCGGSARSSI
jgi:hypothetical protein